MTILQEYNCALIKGDTDKCAEIEQTYDLYGYPPELVTVGLVAVEMGFDPADAVDDYIAAV